MWQPYAAASALTLANAIGIHNIALAQNLEIPFSGNVPIQATFSNVVTGPTEARTTSGSAKTANAIESLTPTTVTVQSNTPAKLTISPPRLISGPTPDPDGTNPVVFVSFGSTNVTVGLEYLTVNIPAEKTDIELKIRVERPAPYLAGIYKYGVTLTVTP
jgi:hypothetical protein